MLAGLDVALLVIEEADHVVLEGIAALIVAETLLMSLIDGTKARYPGFDGKRFGGIFKRIDRIEDPIIDAAVHGESSRVAQG